MAGRLLQALITLWLLSLAVFVIARVSGDPVIILMPMEASSQELAALSKELGLDRSIAHQYWVYLQNVAQGDFGRSFRYRRPVTDVVGQPLLNTLWLATSAIIFSSVVGVILGVLAATNRGRWPDRVAMLVSLLGQSLPAFAVGIIFILVFSVTLGWLPTSGLGGPAHYVLPVITLGWVVTASVTRLLRSSMLEVLDSEFIKLARAKGLGKRTVVFKHALRNALVPVVTIIGMTYGVLLTGAITTEVVFTWPGLGRLAYNAVLSRDFPLVQFCVLIFAALIIGLNFLVDVSYALLDPRIRA